VDEKGGGVMTITKINGRDPRRHAIVDNRPLCGGGHKAKGTHWQTDISDCDCKRCLKIMKAQKERVHPLWSGHWSDSLTKLVPAVEFVRFLAGQPCECGPFPQGETCLSVSPRELRRHNGMTTPCWPCGARLFLREVGHLHKEILEMMAAPSDVSEQADVLILAIGLIALTRTRWSPGVVCTAANAREVLAAAHAKLEINKLRKWIDQGDGTWAHDKEQTL